MWLIFNEVTKFLSCDWTLCLFSVFLTIFSFVYIIFPCKTGKAHPTNTEHKGTDVPPSHSLSSSASSSRHTLTSSHVSLKSVQSAQTQTESFSPHSPLSSGARVPEPPQTVSNSRKNVSFDHPQDSQNQNHHNNHLHHHRPPTPGRLATEDSLPAINKHMATQWSRQSSSVSPAPLPSNHKRAKTSHSTTQTHDLGQNAQQEDEEDYAAPPLSATPPQTLSPVPAPHLLGGEGGAEDGGGDGEEGYLPPLSATPPLHSPGSVLPPTMKASPGDREFDRRKHSSGNSDAMGNQ